MGITDRPYRVVVAGAGVAGLETVLALRELAHDLVDVEVLAPEGDFVYRPLSVVEPFSSGSLYRFPLGELLGAQGARHCRDALAAVRPVEGRLTTGGGGVLEYDSLVVACGGRQVEGLPGALTFRGSDDRDALRSLIEELAAGSTGQVVFAVPGGSGWVLPLYELALLTSAWLEAQAAPRASLVLVTPEPAPLAQFGPAASAAVALLLRERGIDVVPGTYAVAVENGVLRTTAERSIPADRVVTLPRLEGPRIDGLPCDDDGFLPIDEHGAVHGAPDVYAAGDATTFPVKQGGIATQQADAVAEAIAARVGVRIVPRPFRPVLRGLLLTGGEPRFLRTELGGGRGEASQVAAEPLWWPPSKVAGRYLAPYLARLVGEIAEPSPAGAVAVDVEL